MLLLIGIAGDPADLRQAGLILPGLLVSGSQGRAAGGGVSRNNGSVTRLGVGQLPAGVRGVPEPCLSSSGNVQGLLKFRDWHNISSHSVGLSEE